LLKEATERFTKPSDWELLEEIEEADSATASIFPRLLEMYARMKNKGQRDVLYSEGKSRLFSQLLVRSYARAHGIDRLQESAQKSLSSSYQRSVLLIVILMVVAVIITIANTVVINRNLAKRITVLVEGTEIIGAGNLDYRIHAEGNNELSSLARATNEMAGKLKDSHTSVENLYKEIDERKQAEDEVRRLNEDLLRSNRELEQFAYVASHDLQEPLRMVSSYTQLLAKRYEGKLDQDAHDFIHFAVDGANRMQRLIQDLLAYSRITTRGSPFAPLDLHEALGEAVANLQTAISESSAMVTNGELPAVNADPTQLVQVFQNLVGNAIKFRKKDEPLRVHVSAEREGSEWVISVKDNGIGIDPQYFNRLFTIFQRLHGKQEYPGTGVGLAICQRIVTRHGGRIWLESAPGEGATFHFTMKA
jgi:signal transduction histidine kinase